MVSITTLSATDNNITSQTNTQDKITHDTIQTTDHTSNIIKEETKTIEKNNKLNVQASIRDYKNKKLVGNNVVSLKINGKTYFNPKTNKTQTFTVTNGTVNIKNLQVSKNITIKKLMVVTGARQAYLGGRNETTKIVKV